MSSPSSPRRISSPLPNIPLEQGRDIRARAWVFVFDCYRKKEAATSPVSRPDDEKGRSSNDSLASTDCTR